MTPGRLVALRVLFWFAVALVLGALWAPAEAREPYWFLAALAFGACWLLSKRWR